MDFASVDSKVKLTCYKENALFLTPELKRREFVRIRLIWRQNPQARARGFLQTIQTAPA